MHRDVTRLNFPRLRIAIGLAVLALLSGPPRIVAQTTNETASPAPTADATNQSPFKLQVRSNLVVVRVVVRDAQGKPVEGLKKEDFHLFDKGKEQAITQFEVESSVAPPSNPTVTNAPGKTSPLPAMPGKFLALYFDDLNTSDTDMMQARDAAHKYLAPTCNRRPGGDFHLGNCVDRLYR